MTSVGILISPLPVFEYVIRHIAFTPNLSKNSDREVTSSAGFIRWINRHIRHSFWREKRSVPIPFSSVVGDGSRACQGELHPGRRGVLAAAVCDWRDRGQLHDAGLPGAGLRLRNRCCQREGDRRRGREGSRQAVKGGGAVSSGSWCLSGLCGHPAAHNNHRVDHHDEVVFTRSGGGWPDQNPARAARVRAAVSSVTLSIMRPAPPSEPPPGSVVIPDGNAQITGRVAHDDVDGILPCVPDTVFVRGDQGRYTAFFPLGHGGAPLERAGILPAIALKAAGPGNIVGQAVVRFGTARGGVENFDAEGNRVVPGSLGTAAVFRGEPDDQSAIGTFYCRPGRRREDLAYLDVGGIALLGQRRAGRQCQEQGDSQGGGETGLQAVKGGGAVSSGSWCLSVWRVCQVATRPTRQIDRWGEDTADRAGCQGGPKPVHSDPQTAPILVMRMGVLVSVFGRAFVGLLWAGELGPGTVGLRGRVGQSWGGARGGLMSGSLGPLLQQINGLSQLITLPIQLVRIGAHVRKNVADRVWKRVVFFSSTIPLADLHVFRVPIQHLLHLFTCPGFGGSMLLLEPPIEEKELPDPMFVQTPALDNCSDLQSSGFQPAIIG